jgi:Zn-dependent peptidase ImmA (M78 family)
MSMRIDTNTLNYYVQNAQISLDILKSKINHLDQFLSGEKQPTFNQLSDIAKKINIPTGLLLINKTVDTENKRLEFRTISSDEFHGMSEELRDTILAMEIKQDFLHNEITEKLNFIGKYSISDDISIVANAIRKKLEIPEFFQNEAGPNPLNYLRHKINEIGIFVFFNGKVKDNTHRPLDVNEFRGFVLLDDKAPIIFINQKDSKTGQLFTLVHELIHIFVGSEEIFNVIDTGQYQFDRTEAFINKVTAEILVPHKIFLQTNLMNSKILANKFRVSEFVIVRRLLDLQKISLSEYQKRITELQENFDKLQQDKPSGGSYRNNINFMIDKKFFNYIENAVIQDRLSYTDAFNIIGVGFKGYKALKGHGVHE